MCDKYLKGAIVSTQNRRYRIEFSYTLDGKDVLKIFMSSNCTHNGTLQLNLPTSHLYKSSNCLWHHISGINKFLIFNIFFLPKCLSFTVHVTMVTVKNFPQCQGHIKTIHCLIYQNLHRVCSLVPICVLNAK